MATTRISKDEYLKDKNVKDFIEWLCSKLYSGFEHSYTIQKTKKEWKCTSIYDAYFNYEWNGKKIAENTMELNEYSNALRAGIKNNNEEECKTACLGILKWGGVLRGNKEKLNQLPNGQNLVQYLNYAKTKLETGRIESTDYYKDVLMNSGFTKIYSLYIDHFIIYDSRVGAALGFLVRTFCEEKGDWNIPESLRFAYGNSRTKEVNRNPSTDKYKFPLLRNAGISDNHIENNLKANWLLEEVLSLTVKENGKFTKLRELEAALFMIGYRLP